MAPKDEGVTRVEALERFGIAVSQVDGWQTRGNLPFAPVGLLIHHTASDDTRLTTIVDGVNQGGGKVIPGPLVQGYIEDTPDTVCWVVAARRSNHAGIGDPAVLERMRNDEPVQFPPGPDQTGTSANTYLEGVELEGNGPEDFIAGTYVYETAIKYAAAICWWYGWNPLTRVAGHKEWSYPRKTDPAFNMDTFRARVADTIEEFDMTPEQAEVVNWLLDGWPEKKAIIEAIRLEANERRGATTMQPYVRNVWMGATLDHLDADHGGGDHPHPFASLTHTHPVSMSLGTVQAETGAPK